MSFLVVGRSGVPLEDVKTTWMQRERAAPSTMATTKGCTPKHHKVNIHEHTKHQSKRLHTKQKGGRCLKFLPNPRGESATFVPSINVLMYAMARAQGWRAPNVRSSKKNPPRIHTGTVSVSGHSSPRNCSLRSQTTPHGWIVVDLDGAGGYRGPWDWILHVFCVFQATRET